MSATPYSGAALKRSAWHYLSGKAASGLITLFILLGLVRLLPLREYGAYVTFIAVTELGYAVASLGMPWIAARFLPEYRLHARGVDLIAICYRLLIWQATALVVMSLFLLIFGGYYLSWLGLKDFIIAAFLFIVVLLFEGLGRFLREPIMGPLMLQGQARVSLVSRQFIYIILLTSCYLFTTVSLIAVVVIEVVTSLAALLIGLRLLANHLEGLRKNTQKIDWVEPTAATHWAVARRMYLAHLIALTYSPQILISFIVKLLGPEAAALFGFLRSLNDQISRYLPATLLFSLLRPKLMASYVDGGGVKELARTANLAGKLSLFVLATLITSAALVGDSVVTLLSGGKFVTSGALLLGFLFALIPFSQRQLLETVAVAVGKASVCAWASATGLFMLPLTWVLLQFGFILWAPIVAIALGHLLFNAVLLTVLRRSVGYRPDWNGFIKLTASALISYFVCLFIPAVSVGMIWVTSIIQASLVVGCFLFVAWLFKPFTKEERARINMMVKRNIFIW